MFEMLASNKVSSANYLRFVRACIIKALTSSDKSTDQLKEALKGYEYLLLIDCKLLFVYTLE